MALVLKTSSYLRNFTNLARTIVRSTSRREISNVFTFHEISSGRNLSRLLSTDSSSPFIDDAPQLSSQYELERTVRRLDTDVKRFGRITRKEIEDVLEELRQTRAATSTQALLIIRCCGNLIPEESPDVRTKIVNEIWNTLDSLGVPLDISHYNALLRVYLENQHEFSPTDFLVNLEKRGVEPNRVTYQRLIARYCQQGDLEGATRILEFMREKQLPVNEAVFNALIMGHSKADDMASAAGILNVMRQASLEPSAETYTTLLCGYAGKGDIEAINKILEECDAKDVYFQDKDFMDVIYALAVNGHSQHVDAIIGRLKQSAGYNQDAQNLILRLINCGQEQVALKILKTMPRSTRSDGQFAYSGVFFIRQMIKVNRPVETIMEMCKTFEAEGLNPEAIFMATETALRVGNMNVAVPLMAAMRERGFPIRQHYFWPLIVAQGKQRDENGILNILSIMTSEFGLNISNETLKDYVIPNFQSKSLEEIVSVLRVYNISPASITSALVQHLLSEKNIKDAALAASKFKAFYSPTALRKPLAAALKATKDTTSFVTILRYVYEGLDRALEHPGLLFEEDQMAGFPSRTELVGQYVIEAVNYLHEDKAPLIKNILQELVNHGLSMSNSSAQLLQNKLGYVLSTEISHLLDKLTSGELVPVPVTRTFTQTVTQPVQDEQAFLNMIDAVNARGESVIGLKRQLLAFYCYNKELEKAEALYEELVSSAFVPSAGVYAQMIDLYVNHENLDKVQEFVQKVEELDPPVVLEDIKIIRVASLMVKKGKLSDALEYLKRQPVNRRTADGERSYLYNSTCWRLLNSLAEEGRHNDLKEMFNILVERKFVEVNGAILGPLIKVHLVNKDLESALTEFEICCHQYKQTPLKGELTCQLIEAEDATALQRLTDLSTQIHGEVNSLYDLVFAFVECGRIRQARRILETPGLRSRPQRLQFVCERFQQEGRITSLEGLLEATRDISHIDHADIYYHLLQVHCKNGDTDKALGLWTRMQEEDVQPSEEFLYHLGTYLKAQGEPVPFAVPQPPSPPEEEPDLGSLPPNLSKFKRAVRDGDVDIALQILPELEKRSSYPSVTDMSYLIEGLVKANRLNESLKLTMNVLQSGQVPSIKVLNFLVSRLSNAGDIEALQNLGNFFNNELQKRLSYNNRLCRAYANSGKELEFLDKLEKEINSATDKDLPTLAEKFPKGGAVAFLENENTRPRFLKLAEKYADHGIIIPMNVVWMHYFINGEDEKAEQIWQKHLVKEEVIMFQRILGEVRRNGMLELGFKLLAKLRERPNTTASMFGIIYSALVDSSVIHQNYDEALSTVEKSLTDTTLENYNPSVLRRLKFGLEAQRKKFPYQIPENVIRSSKSNVNSLDEDTTSEENNEMSQHKT